MVAGNIVANHRYTEVFNRLDNYKVKSLIMLIK